MNEKMDSGGVFISNDYGTMELTFGRDINNSVLKFVMSNSENSITLTNLRDGGVGCFLCFSEDGKNIGITYSVRGSQPFPTTSTKEYQGWGTRQ